MMTFPDGLKMLPYQKYRPQALKPGDLEILNQTRKKNKNPEPDMNINLEIAANGSTLRKK